MSKNPARSRRLTVVLSLPILLIASGIAAPNAAAAAPCEPGAYGRPDQDVVVLERKAWIPSPHLGYILLDGRYGSTADQNSPISCHASSVALRLANGRLVVLQKRIFLRTKEQIPAAGATLVGELLEPAQPAEQHDRPLVVMVHGSEKEAAISNNRAYLLAAQGVSVFTYDKRGTGQSGGEYTQNFELLADDAAAAMAHAQAVARGRFGRSGYWGQSQGGWVAPLAATRSKVDFVAVGFGLVASPIEEDRDQMLLEAQTLGLGESDLNEIRQLSDATATVVSSHFATGLDELEALRHRFAGRKWVQSISGEYSGEMLRMSDADLRRVGQALFDNLEIIWDYDARPALRSLKTPLLWTIAEKDRAAPAAGTLAALASLKALGKPFDVYVFPGTDHGMYEFVERKSGERVNTRVTDGYFRLIGDWVLGLRRASYGNSHTLSPAN
ncbi:MAG: alpha/beta fold hydrolase [Sphingobium sp.]|nr:alpha/beta fold hydrolase [Sphingobium sp.]